MPWTEEEAREAARILEANERHRPMCSMARKRPDWARCADPIHRETASYARHLMSRSIERGDPEWTEPKGQER